MRFVAYSYTYLARPALNRFGEDGEKAIRRGLRMYGNLRGKLMRKWHGQIELPINMESIHRAWYGSSYITAGKSSTIFEESAVFKPYFVQYKYAPCAFHDVWKEENFEREGYMYCDEIHQEVAMAYHPNAIVEIHENLNKGDQYCHFKWMMPPEIPAEEIDKSGYEEIEKNMKENPRQEFLSSLERQTKCCAIIYSCIANSLMNQFGKSGEKLVREALRDLGLKEAMRIKVKLKDAGKDLTVKNALYESSLPYGLLWNIDIRDFNGSVEADVEYCPHGEVWSEIGHEKQGSIYCQEIYENVFRGLYEKATVNVISCMMKKDGRCKLEFKI